MSTTTTTTASITATEKKCTGCGQIGAGHLRPWSKKCPQYEQYIANKNKKSSNEQDIAPGDKDTDDVTTGQDVNTPEDQLKQDAAEQNLLDCMGFDDANCIFVDSVEKDEESSNEDLD